MHGVEFSMKKSHSIRHFAQLVVIDEYRMDIQPSIRSRSIPISNLQNGAEGGRGDNNFSLPFLSHVCDSQGASVTLQEATQEIYGGLHIFP